MAEKTPDEIRELADIFRQRARVGWRTLLTPETTKLVADALDAYAPAPPQPPPIPTKRDRFYVDLYADGSTVYRLDVKGEIFEIVAWAKSTIVAHAAFDKLLTQYPNSEFMQKRRSWVERESIDIRRSRNIG